MLLLPSLHHQSFSRLLSNFEKDVSVLLLLLYLIACQTGASGLSPVLLSVWGKERQRELYAFHLGDLQAVCQVLETKLVPSEFATAVWSTFADQMAAAREYPMLSFPKEEHRSRFSTQ